jgi:membrane associated rhomboid family serine protease
VVLLFNFSDFESGSSAAITIGLSIQILSSITTYLIDYNPNLAHEAHLGAFLMGLAILFCINLWRKFQLRSVSFGGGVLFA